MKKKKRESRASEGPAGLGARRALSRPLPARFSPRNSRWLMVTRRPRALSRRIAWSALGRFAVAPNLAALVFLSSSFAREERASFAVGLSLNQENQNTRFSPLHRTAPTSPSSSSTRATSCTASSAAHRRTTTPGSSTSWTRVSFFFFFEAESRVQREREQPWLTREFNHSKHRLPGLGALLPPLRRPHRLWLALPAAQVREIGEEGAREGGKRELVWKREFGFWLFFRAISSLRVARPTTTPATEEIKKLTHFFPLTPTSTSTKKKTKQRDQARRDLQPRRAVARPGLVPAPAVHRRGLRGGELGFPP